MSWTCGDCGTEYKDSVEYCKHPKRDRAAIEGWSKGVDYERERIIKLLEVKDYRGNGPTFTLIELKRLIKGEQK